MTEDQTTPADSAKPPKGDRAATMPKRSGLTLEVGPWQALAAALLLAVGFAGGWFANTFVNRDSLAHDANERLILQAWDNIDANYVVTASIDHKKMAYAAIDAMVKSLGDTNHSRFEPREQVTQETNQLNGVPEAGIGAVLSGGGGAPARLRVLFPGSPAAASALRPGDEIVAVDGVAAQGKTLQEVRALLLGPEHTPVTMSVARPSASGTSSFTVTLTRAFFAAPSVESYFIPGANILDVHIIQFGADADGELEAAIQDARARGLRGIVLDLRDDPGGYLDEGVQIASEFLADSNGTNVLIQRTRDVDQPIAVRPRGKATGVPLAVVVNGGSASSSEVVAGALAVNRPDVRVVGETTAGTGTILETLYLRDGSALVLGTSEWLLPNGRSIYHVGLTPDQPVALADDVVPLSPSYAQQQGYTLAQVLASGDAQLARAIQDLQG